MRFHSFSHHHGFHHLFVIADIFAVVATIVAFFALAVIRYGAGRTWHSQPGHHRLSQDCRTPASLPREL